MSRQVKLLDRLKKKPKNFTWGELVTVMEGFGYQLERGSGSRRRFIHTETLAIMNIHEPHPQKELKAYQVKFVLNHLREERLL
jgi:hypothetical protein